MFEIRFGEETVRTELRSPVVIGSHEGADVSLADPEGINRRHALLVKGTTGWSVFDLDSTTGTRVNGVRTAREDLAPGDEIAIGKARLRLLADGAPTEAGARLDALAAQLLADSDIATVLADRCRVRAEHLGEWVMDALVDGNRTLGYSSKCGLRLPHDGISSVHALLVRDSGAWQLYDLRSDLGLLYLGKRVASLELSYGDVVKLGNLRLHFELLNDPDVVEKPAKNGPTAESSEEPSPDASDSSLDFKLDDTPPGAVDRLRFGDEAMTASKPSIAAEHFLAGCETVPWSLPMRRRLRGAQAKLCGREATEPPDAVWPLARAQWRARRALLKGRLEDALKAAEAGLAIDPWNRGLLVIQAAAYERKGMLDGALWCLNVGLRRRPDDPLLNTLIGRLYKHLGSTVRAIKHLERALAADPMNRELSAELQSAMVDKTIGANRK